MSWDRKLWAIEMTGCGHRRPSILGDAWAGLRPALYEGQPANPLLFLTRKQAREWCRLAHQKWGARSDACSKWRFRPRRVRSTVTSI